MTPARQLRQLILNHPPVVAPGAYDGLSARLVEQAGFAAVYATGGGIARGNGIPDLGLMSLDEIVKRLETMVEVTQIPLIADADTGHGNALNAQKTARAFERVGVAGFHLEDQVFPKKCGHYDDKSIVPQKEMTQKIRAVKDALHDPDMVLIARTDGLAVEGYGPTLERAHAYMDAGADAIFVEAPTSEEQIEQIAKDLPQPKLINMFHGGKTPLMPADRLGELGYSVIIIPSDTQRAAIKGMQDALEVIRRDGHSAAMQERMVSFKGREEVIGTAEYTALDKKYGV
ncbi:isocitrate lyase and phosphorylmutase [Spiribacter salinus M19-40]|uniref:Isocitrate lyase and phosphorylmutase n=1 Tax=Spiribacter salinus M19-40 TaxID=1260251 RepID=R4V2C8_9GAMM|nr:oxaloacetate decarboxylase [Spiribacter salinus]AGM40194.1 isocitrate lyase and phosphorylmutase [Spiribacter salinus M19-40]MBY5268575.1 isocitrate lyase [Spiribacter salinus]